eukprot:943438-Pleurochrysis_carterae.AAC.2
MVTVRGSSDAASSDTCGEANAKKGGREEMSERRWVERKGGGRKPKLEGKGEGAGAGEGE